MNEACLRQIVVWLKGSKSPTLKDLRPGLRAMFLQVKSPRAFHNGLKAHDAGGTLLAKAKKVRRNHKNRQSLQCRQDKHKGESALQATNVEKLSSATAILAHSLCFEASTESARRAGAPCFQACILPIECTPSDMPATTGLLFASPNWRAHSQRVIL